MVWEKRRGACRLTFDVAHSPTCNYPPRRGGGGLQGNMWYSPPAGMTSRLASVTFQNGEQSVHRIEANWRIKISILSRKYCYSSDFLDLEILRSLLSWKTRQVLFWNEMSSGVMNFIDSFLSSSKFYGQSYRPVTVLRASAQQDWGI